jgi:regulator of protease activity HflC (stomatin/prohibitin superfamily)
VQGRSDVSVVAGIIIGIISFVMLGGFFTLQPNESAVLTLFGAYKGTTRQNGFLWANPFYRKQKISLRVRNLNGEKLKVNDKRGNPVEIAVVIVWRIKDTAQAVFDVDSYDNFIRIQSESCVRHIASSYFYDDGEAGELTLRGGGAEIATALAKELQERLERAGIGIEEARLTHLAYSPEIAQTMLRRQQAEAVIAARQKIVFGAVGMVEMALRELSEKGVVKLDEERKAAMVSNLLVVLCSESQAQPVLNAGTLYS